MFEMKQQDRKNQTTSIAIVLIIITFMLMMAISSIHPQKVQAITLEEASQKVSETSAALAQAESKQKELATEIADLSGRIAELEEQIPVLEEKAKAVCKAMYKHGDGVNELLDALLGARSIREAIDTVQGYEKLLAYQTDQLFALEDAKAELDESKAKLEADKVEADANVEAAKQALAEAQQARAQAQAEARAKNGGALAQEIDWSLTHDEFVSHWGSRINSYLRGTPLSGYGETFADAAYKYGVDPRWSPAISRIESGCGAHCFRSHNAWGWMGKSFSNWSDAIYGHVNYLSGPLYGGYITPGGAATYCPPGGPWYSAVSGEMRRM